MSLRPRLRFVSIAIIAGNLLGAARGAASADRVLAPDGLRVAGKPRLDSGEVWKWLGYQWIFRAWTGNGRGVVSTKAGIIIDPNGEPFQGGSSPCGLPSPSSAEGAEPGNP